MADRDDGTRVVNIDPQDGHLAIVIPNFNDRTRPAEQSNQEYLDQVVLPNDIPSNVTHYIIHVTNPPPNRYFRSSLELASGGVVRVNTGQAGSIHMARIREVRDHALAGLDAPWMIAIEAGGQVLAGQIAAQKQVLRDIPQTF